MEEYLKTGDWVIKLNPFSIQCLQAAGIDVVFNEIDPALPIEKVSKYVKDSCDRVTTPEEKKGVDIALYALALSLVRHRKVVEFLTYVGYH